MKKNYIIISISNNRFYNQLINNNSKYETQITIEQNNIKNFMDKKI